MELDTSRLARLAREQSRDEFVAALPHLFLVVNTPREAQANEAPQLIRALTATVDGRGLVPPGARGMEILPLKKAPGNAHPDQISIGRAQSCDVVLSESSVSKLQAWFREGPPAQLTDFDSRNGTRVNGTPLVANQPTAITVGDHLEFGRLACRLVDAARLHDLLRTLSSLRATPLYIRPESNE